MTFLDNTTLYKEIARLPPGHNGADIEGQLTYEGHGEDTKRPTGRAILGMAPDTSG